MGDKSTWVRFPMVECPACEKEFRVDEAVEEYYLLSGSIIECSHCEAGIHIWELDTVTEARISLVKEDEDDGDNTTILCPLCPIIH